MSLHIPLSALSNNDGEQSPTLQKCLSRHAPRKCMLLMSKHVPVHRREQASKHIRQIHVNIHFSLTPRLQETPELSNETPQMYKSTIFQIIPIGLAL